MEVLKKQIVELERKAKSGWRAYYITRDRMLTVSEAYNESIKTNKELVAKIKSNEDIDLAFLKKQFVEMHYLLNKIIECPVCLESLSKESVVVLNCGHTLCKDCKEKIPDKKCPCCRKY